MEVFKNTRLRIGKFTLLKKMKRSKRRVIYSRIDMVKTIGIVWDASNPDHFLTLSRFHQKMQERKIEVKILGYFPGQELPDRYTAIRYLTCLRKNEIGFFFNPVTPEALSFIDRNFDILIDINFKKIFPLHYISSLSNAGFKVGLFNSETSDTPFDLMMDIKSPVDIENYLNQAILYLEMINSGRVKHLTNK
jgi:hypothetical protein